MKVLWDKIYVFGKNIEFDIVLLFSWAQFPKRKTCMRQVPGPGVLGRPRGIGRRGMWERGLGWGIRVKPWMILVNV